MNFFQSIFGHFERKRKRRNKLYELLNNIKEIQAKQLDLLNALNFIKHFPDKTIRFPYKTLNGKDVLIKLYLPYYDKDMLSLTIIKNNTFHENNVLNQLAFAYLKKIKHRIKVVDVGANIGNHTIFFSKVCGADVVSFEPQKNCFETLKLNCELNSVNCECFNVAIGEDNRKVSIDQFDSLNLGGNSFSYSDTCDDDNIVCRSLDSFSFEYIDLIKIDVEGFEIEVLKNSINTIKRHKPLIFIEVFPDNFSKVMNIMKDLNYSIIQEFPYFNYLFCHNDSVFC